MAQSPVCKTRRKCADTTRTAILEAAREKFAHTGYDQTGLREIAAAAGIDASLICRYFGSKQELLAAVLDCQSKFSGALAERNQDMGARLAEQLLMQPDKAGPPTQLLVMLRAASSPEASPLLKNSIETGFLAPLRARLTGAHRAERALLIAASIFGVAVMRFVLSDGAQTRDGQLAAMLGRLLQESIEPADKIAAE